MRLMLCHVRAADADAIDTANKTFIDFRHCVTRWLCRHHTRMRCRAYFRYTLRCHLLCQDTRDSAATLPAA